LCDERRAVDPPEGSVGFAVEALVSCTVLLVVVLATGDEGVTVVLLLLKGWRRGFLQTGGDAVAA
jgi:hypothetical protein